MTKRHFEDFARRIKADRDYVAPCVLTDEDATNRRKGQDEAELIDRLRTYDETAYAAALIAAVAAEHNPRFDRARFFKACGITL